jgi:PTS system glucitol/sorbitol-specific IIA component
MKTLYQTTVIGIGDLVPAFIDEGILVFFGEGAPEELWDFCIMHKVESQDGQVRKGDIVEIDESKFEILAVGSVANDNLMNLGHLNLKANGNTEPDLPGDVCIAQVALPKISVGTKIKIYREQ